MGRPKSHRPPGRPKGPLKRTIEARECFRLCLENLAPELEGMLRQVASEDAARAVELLLKLSERFIPTLTRSEGAPPDAPQLTINITRTVTQPSLPASQPEPSQVAATDAIVVIPSG